MYKPVMRRLVDKWNICVVILFLFLKFLQLLRRLGVKPAEDGWRQAARGYLSTEHSKFVLACLGLDVFIHPKKEFIIKGLAEFLQQQPTMHWQLIWGRFSARRVKKDIVDIVETDFNEDGTLKSLIPYLGSPVDGIDTKDTDGKLKEALLGGIIEAYNKTSGVTDRRRPWALKRYLDKWILTQALGPGEEGLRAQAQCYGERILSAVFIHFEEAASDRDCRRFEPPLFTKHQHPGWGIFNIICRLNDNSNEVDVWIQCSHICIDGLPVQEVLQALKLKWGGSPVKFPPLSWKNEITEELCSSKNDKGGIYYASQIVDFRPLIGLAEELKEKYKADLDEGGVITPLRLFIWKLGNHSVFKERKFLIPVDVPEYCSRERTLGLVVIRPSSFLDKYGYEKGFLAFLKEFERQVRGALGRCSESYELMESYALLAPMMYVLTFKLMPLAVKEFIGSMGVSVIRNADVFVAPLTDVHMDAYIAISNFFTPTEDGGMGCYVNMKGPKDKIRDYLLVVEEIAGAQA